MQMNIETTNANEIWRKVQKTGLKKWTKRYGSEWTKETKARVDCK